MREGGESTGFGLIETTVALVIGVIMIAGATLLYRQSERDAKKEPATLGSQMAYTWDPRTGTCYAVLHSKAGSTITVVPCGSIPIVMLDAPVARKSYGAEAKDVGNEQ